VQEETLQPVLVAWVLALPSNTLLLLHCVLGHDPDSEAGVQYKLVQKRKQGL
jgi:hypothetical protein